MLPGLPPYLIYLHGFKSSPASYKAQYLQGLLERHDWADHFSAPLLDYRPRRAMEQLQQQVEQRLRKFNITLIGSSLGGYYATFLVEKYGVSAVLINPAVAPYRMMAENLGMHQNYHTQQPFEITRNEVEQLRQLEVPGPLRTDNYLVMLQTGDETLDYREAAAKYADCSPLISSGGSHGFDHFDRVVPDILAFAGIEFNSDP